MWLLPHNTGNKNLTLYLPPSRTKYIPRPQSHSNTFDSQPQSLQPNSYSPYHSTLTDNSPCALHCTMQEAEMRTSMSSTTPTPEKVPCSSFPPGKVSISDKAINYSTRCTFRIKARCVRRIRLKERWTISRLLELQKGFEVLEHALVNVFRCFDFLLMVSVVYDILFAGVLQKAGEWGGPECRAVGEKHVSNNMRIIETGGWLIVSVSVWYLLDVPGLFRWMEKSTTKELEAQAQSKMNAKPSLLLAYERVLASIHFAMTMQLVYWKFNDKVMIMLAQPCHVLLFLQGVALLSTTSLGPLITVLQLPTLFGALLAMIVPATSGLTPFEVTCYWLEHILIQIGPFYLLSRQNFIALKICNLKTFVMGVWICQVAHWTFYDWVDQLAEVNVEFMLCPTFGMVETFKSLPPYLLLPSWRSTLTWFVAISAVFLSNGYALSARIIRFMVASSAEANTTKKKK